MVGKMSSFVPKGIKKIFPVVLAVIISGCGIYFHSPSKARKRAATFIDLVYMKGKAEEAFALAHKSFRENYSVRYLEKLGERMKSRFGRLEGVSADFYITAQGEKRMEIYYTGISEKKLSYHKITLIGDSFGGYKVAG